VPPVVVRARAAPRTLRLHPVDCPTAPAHEVADEFAAADPRPDHTRAWRRHDVSRQDALGPEPEPEKQAEGKDEGPRPAGQAEETNPTKSRPAPDAATAETRAEEREARRPARGTVGPPPAHQETEAPAARAPATPETEETEDDAPGAKRRAAGQGGETGPNAAKTQRREDAPKASAVPATSSRSSISSNWRLATPSFESGQSLSRVAARENAGAETQGVSPLALSFTYLLWHNA
jgi:hypothetical protein